MALSSEEKQLNKEFEGKDWKQGWLGCGGLVVVVVLMVVLIVVFKGVFKSDKKGEEPKETYTVLLVEASFDGAQFIVTNKDSFDWTDVELEINSGIIRSGFIYRMHRLAARETYSIGAMQFAKGDGTRFNPFATKPMGFSISCKTPMGDGFWSGSFEQGH